MLRQRGQGRRGCDGSGLLLVTGDLDRVLAGVDGARMAATVATLAGAPFEGRRAGGTAARDWLADRLNDLGATVTDDRFPVRSVPEVYADPAAIWNGRPLVFGREAAVHPASADLPSPRAGELTVAGQGDPRGRWLAVPPGMGLFDAYGHAHDAAGLLVGRAVDAYGWHYTMLAGPDPGPLPVLMLDPTTHSAVLDGSGWFSAAAPVRRTDVTAANLHATWHPSAPVLLTAHYDGVGDLPGLRQPAAADNGSGVAVVLEAARLLAGHVPVEVALLDAEELGALGSAHHAARLQQAGRTPLVINIDGAGHLDGAAAVEAGGPAHGLLAALDQAGRHTGLPLVAGPVASDNRRYAAAGLAAVGIGAGMRGYHSPADTADRVETATLAAVCRLVVATVWLAADYPAKLSSLIGD